MREVLEGSKRNNFVVLEDDFQRQKMTTGTVGETDLFKINGFDKEKFNPSLTVGDPESQKIDFFQQI